MESPLTQSSSAPWEQKLQTLLTRRSVSPRRLQEPGPGPSELEAMVLAALRAPDHGELHPWRVIEFRSETRKALAECFAQEKLRRNPQASALDLERAREHALRVPMLLGFVVSVREQGQVPMREQWLCAGAALGNLLNAAHQLGYGAMVLSGERCFDPILARELGVADGESLVGFVSIGTIKNAPPHAPESPAQTVLTAWSG